MQSRAFRDNTIAVLALFVLPASAYGVDWILFRWRLYAEQSFSISPYMWALLLASLPVAAVALAFAYWLVTRSAAHRLVGLAHMVVGVLGVVYIPLVFLIDLRLPMPIAMFARPVSYFHFTVSVMAVAGAFHLLRGRPES